MYTASKPKLEDIQSVRFDKGSERMIWKTLHTHKKSSAVLNFHKESSLKVLEMIFSKLKNPEVSVPARKKMLYLHFDLTQGITAAILAKSSCQ